MTITLCLRPFNQYPQPVYQAPNINYPHFGFGSQVFPTNSPQYPISSSFNNTNDQNKDNFAIPPEKIFELFDSLKEEVKQSVFEVKQSQAQIKNSMSSLVNAAKAPKTKKNQAINQSQNQNQAANQPQGQQPKTRVQPKRGQN